jgi:hypothetical protein
MAVDALHMAGTNDFVAVLDADPAGGTYGKVLASTDAGSPGAMAHHVENRLPVGRALFASDYTTGKVFLIDLAVPLAPRIVRRIDSIPGFRHPHSFVRLANGNVLASLQFGNGSLPGDPGGIAEFDPMGQIVRTVSSADTAFPGARIRTYAIEVLPAIDRVLTTSSPMDSENTTDVIQLWRLSDLHLLKTVAVPAVPGDSIQHYPFEVRALPGGGTALMNTYNCGFYLLTDLETEQPKLSLVHELKEQPRFGCSVPVISGHFWVMPVAYAHSVVVLDIADPSNPVEVSVLRTDSTFNPHWSALDPASDRVVITGQGDGEPRVLIARLDRATGQLSWDARFHDPDSSRPGISFRRETWPHGRIANAMPHGALFGPSPR